MRTGLLLACIASAALAMPSASAGRQDQSPPRLVGTPNVNYLWVESHGRRSPGFGVVVKLSRRLTRSEQDRSRYGLVVAPRLRRGQKLPDRLFGGNTLGRTGDRGRCYSAQPLQLPSRPRPKSGARWHLGVIDARSRIVGPVKRVTLKRVRPGVDWILPGMRRLGCLE